MTGDHLHDRARLRGQDLVVGAVEQEQRCVAELGRVLAAGRLRRERHDAAAVRAEHRAGLDRDRAAERMTHDDEATRAGTAREIGRRGDVVHAARQVVRLAVADAHRRDAVRLGELAPEGVVDAVGRAEHAAHPAAARDDDVARVAWAVPQHGEQSAHRVDLEVREPGRDLDFLDAERFEQLERRARVASVAHNIDFSSARVCARSSRDP